MSADQTKGAGENFATSGDIVAGQELSIDLGDAKQLRTGEVRVSFSRMSPDASPGWNTLTISGLPAGTRGITAWVTEWKSGNRPHAGGAWFTTNSVQLFENGTKCRVRFHSSWGSHLPAGAQIIYG